MEKVKSIIRSDGFILSALLIIIAGLLYPPFISKFGYFNDDWYLMYAAMKPYGMSAIEKSVFAFARVQQNINRRLCEGSDWQIQAFGISSCVCRCD